MFKSLKIGNLDIKIPIIQGGMGVGISLSGMASAVANEGGVGVIASAGLGLIYKNRNKSFLENSIIGLKEEIKKAKQNSKGVIGINVMVAMSNFSDMVKTAISEKVDIIFSGGGLPLNLPSFLNKESATKLVPIVSSARAAKIICKKWIHDFNYPPDAIVVEGPKAGGHLGFKETQIDDDKYSLEKIIPEVLLLTKEIEDEHDIKIPVIAAGGIYTGKDISNIIALGASGVQMGTRFVTTTECDASMEFKQAYINAKADDIQIIISPVGMPGRAIKNDFLLKVENGESTPKKCPFKCIKTCDISTSPYCIILALYNAYKGKTQHGYAFAGINAYLSEKIITVKQTFENIIEEYKRG